MNREEKIDEFEAYPVDDIILLVCCYVSENYFKLRWEPIVRVTLCGLVATPGVPKFILWEIKNLLRRVLSLYYPIGLPLKVILSFNLTRQCLSGVYTTIGPIRIAHIFSIFFWRSDVLLSVFFIVIIINKMYTHVSLLRLLYLLKALTNTILIFDQEWLMNVEDKAKITYRTNRYPEK